MTTLSEDDLLHALRAWPLAEPVRLAPIAGGFTSNVWYVDTPARRLVAKYIYDAQIDADAGLRAAEVLAAAGITCSTPLHTTRGELSLMVEGPHGRVEPLALLQFVPGAPLDFASAEAPAIAGELLGRVHTAWQRSHPPLRPADRIFSYLEEETPEVAVQPGLQALIDRVLVQVRRFEATTHVSYGPIFGDRIEILREHASGAVGLIDTGAVGWGPLLFDVALMHDAFAEDCTPASPRHRFLRAYMDTAPIHEAELAGLAQYAALHAAQLAKYFAWRLAHHVTLGDDAPDANARSLAELRAALSKG